MKQKKLLALCGAVAVSLVTAAAALAASSTGPAVTVTVKSLSKTLAGPATVHGEKGAITKGGAPKGRCPGRSAAGALDAATHHRWNAKYYASLKDVFITSILGVKPKSKDFWEIVINGKVASTGACEIKLKPGEKLLFKIAK